MGKRKAKPHLFDNGEELAMETIRGAVALTHSLGSLHGTERELDMFLRLFHGDAVADELRAPRIQAPK